MPTFTFGIERVVSNSGEEKLELGGGEIFAGKQSKLIKQGSFHVDLRWEEKKNWDDKGYEPY